MTELIGDWLMNSVGCSIKFTPEVLGKACFDGKLFAQILVSYNIISSEYLKLINTAVGDEQALSNLKKLCVWFKLLDISITDQFLNEIAKQNGSASLKLLYDLYNRLENRENMCYMDRKKHDRILSESTNRFEVFHVTEKEPMPDMVDEKQYLNDILSTMKGSMLSAEKATVKRFLMDVTKHRTSVINKKIIEELKLSPNSMVSSEKIHLCDCLNIKAKINEFEEFGSSSEGIDDSSQLYQCSTKDYISYLKLKRRKTEADKKLKLKMEKNAMEDAWKQILGDQEIKLKNILSNKLLKQSEYEKQMMLRLKRMRMKYKKFIDNRNVIVDMTEKQETFNQFRGTFHTVKIKEMTLVEKQRIKKLHQRLFREKMRLRNLNNLKACRRIMEDIIDYAMIKADYLEKNGLNIPKSNINELKLLFIKGVRLLPHELTPKTISDHEDPPIQLDDVRIHELAESDFHLYMYRVGQWCFKFPEDEPEQLNITGFIVHRLLDLKYNFNLGVGTPADLPSYSYRIFLRYINDAVALERLKSYLTKFKINVIDVFTVINYFLNAYKVYIGIDVLKDLTKSGSPLKSKPNSARSKKGNEKKIKTAVKLKTKFDKSFQFPSSEDVVKDKPFSETARLGQFVYEFLQEGGLLPDTFVCYLIIEYLKTLKDISGFMLVNYPENITQLAILEYMLTGLEVSFMPIITDNIKKLMTKELESVRQKINVNPVTPPTNDKESKTSYLKEDYKIVSQTISSIEELAKLQNSNILPKPNTPSIPPPFESYFTKVILLQREEDSRRQMALKKSQKSLEVEGEIGEENSVTLENFYAALGISSNFSWRNLDSSTLKRLLKFVLNVSSSQQQEFYKNLGSEVIVPIKPIGTGAKKSFLKHVEKPDLVDYIQEMFACNGEEIFDEIQEEICYEEDMNIYPGHKYWEYTDLAISETYATVLATAWESIEYFFTNNIKECFGLQRTVQNRLMPYRNYIRKKAGECLNLEDDRTQVVTNFQLMLNAIDDQFRSIDTMKNDLHYRTLKLKCDLWRMTDVKKFYCEQVLELIKDQNWITNHKINLLRVYSLILQVEADRFADTLQLIEDYYYVCLLNYTHDERLTKLILPRIAQTGKKKVENLDKQSNLKSVNSQKKYKSKSIKSQEILRDLNSVWKSSLFHEDFEKQENPVLAMLSSLISMLVKSISEMKMYCLSKIDNVVVKCNARILSEKKRKSTREKKVNSKGLEDDLVNTVLNPNKYPAEITEKIISNKVFPEWIAAIENETNRVLYRVSLIEKRAIADIIEDFTVIENTFKEFEQNIATLYHSQILNIDKVCDLMRAAIEEETKIQPLILLKTDSLEIDRSVILFPNPPLPPPPSLVELQTDLKFTISQLTNLFLKLVYVAPFGIVEQTFVQILEDMVCMGHEMGHCYLPNLWSSLSSIQIKDIVHRLFGDKAIIDWRLFIISALDVDFPTLENILAMKTKFQVLDTNLTETVTYEQYSCVFLWFESAETWSIHKDLYFAKAKELIFKMFQVGENLMNYTDFLLAFCRDVDSSEGFVKALAVAEGCATVAWKQDLFRETFQIEQENEKYTVAYGILTILLARVSRIIDSVIITEVSNEEEALSFGGRRSSGTLKNQTIEGTCTSQGNLDLSMSKDVSSHQRSADENEMTWKLNSVEKQPQILWKSDVYFSTVLSLFLVDIHNFSLSSDHIYDTIDIEKNLKQIFINKGTGHSMKLFTLMNHGYFKKLLYSYKCFQIIPLSQMVAKLVNNKGKNSFIQK